MSKIPQEGYVLVPVNLTRELGDKMLDAMWPNGDLAHDEAFNGPEEALSAGWSAMIATIPADAARAQGAEVAVKPLEWENRYGSTYYAQSIVGQWARWEGYYRPPNSSSVACSDPIAAAQAHYEQRIHSALTTPPAPQPAEREKVLGEALKAMLPPYLEWKELKSDAFGVTVSHPPSVLRQARAALAGGEA